MGFVKIWVHLVWTTKKREPILTREIRWEIFKHIRENAELEIILKIKRNIITGKRFMMNIRNLFVSMGLMPFFRAKALVLSGFLNPGLKSGVIQMRCFGSFS